MFITVLYMQPYIVILGMHYVHTVLAYNSIQVMLLYAQYWMYKRLYNYCSHTKIRSCTLLFEEYTDSASDFEYLWHDFQQY